MKALFRSANSVRAIDAGATHVKVAATRHREERNIPSGSDMTARAKGQDVKRVPKDWEHGLVSSGYPGPVIHGRPLHEPHSLGGWGGFNFGKTAGCPVEVVNNAAVQALETYEGGRMLFGASALGLAHLPYKDGKTYEGYIGARGLKGLGKSRRLRHSTDVVELLKDALEAGYVAPGGDNSKIIEKPPPDTCLGNHRRAFVVGFRLAEKRTKPRLDGHEAKASAKKECA
jgi:polyphosphate glucokinase